MNDSVLVNVDTITFNGNGKFQFEVPLTEPEVFYLYLDKKDENPLNDRLLLFGEPGDITVNTTREYFDVNASVTGSKNHDKFKEYSKIKTQFTNKNLDLIKEKFTALKNNEIKKADSLEAVSEQNSKRMYLYAINFAMNNKDAEVSPYIALSDLYNANVKYLDTINNSLTDRVKKSKYGVMLEDFITEIKNQECK
jgi:hypothetical protein